MVRKRKLGTQGNILKKRIPLSTIISRLGAPQSVDRFSSLQVILVDRCPVPSDLQPGGRPSPKKNVLPSPIAPTEVFKSTCGIAFDTKRGFDTHRSHRHASPMCRGGFDRAERLSVAVTSRDFRVRGRKRQLQEELEDEAGELLHYMHLHSLHTLHHFTRNTYVLHAITCNYINYILLHMLHTFT